MGQTGSTDNIDDGGHRTPTEHNGSYPTGGRSIPRPTGRDHHNRGGRDWDQNYSPAQGGLNTPFSGPRSLSDRVRNIIDPDGGGETPKTPLTMNPKQLETVPTAFKWNHGGNQVFLTGSFNAWQGKIMMTRSEDVPDEFVLVIDIVPGVHRYKFIVDEEWRLNPDYPTEVDQGVVNNTVEVKRPVFEDHSRTPFQDSDDEAEVDGKQKPVYGQIFPNAEDYIKDPPKIPPHLTSVLLNTPTAQSANALELPIPPHVTLNHLYVSKLGNADQEDPNVIVTAVTKRFKTQAFAHSVPKFVTTVYYAPSIAYQNPSYVQSMQQR